MDQHTLFVNLFVNAIENWKFVDEKNICPKFFNAVDFNLHSIVKAKCHLQFSNVYEGTGRHYYLISKDLWKKKIAKTCLSLHRQLWQAIECKQEKTRHEHVLCSSPSVLWSKT